ncbi:MAG: zinc ABC transporter substrate-binding protein [Myxococcaceae bacterium]|nr:zinc ABC transporter substrate-binding protein [Myxococcaceae bacterium]MBH2006367.1 zinc ABC transporter substrate-binding protein [Myxococcaceae bacterium]
MKFFLLPFLALTSIAAPMKVVTTLPILKNMVEAVGGNRVTVQSLAEPNQDAHFVQPKPTFMKKVRHADAFVEVGLELELWAQKVIDSAGNPKLQMSQPGRIIASAGIATLEIPSVLTRQMGDVHPYGNPHIWLDPIRVKKMAKNIANGLALVDPSGKATYEANLKLFETKIDQSMIGWEKTAQSIQNKKLVTYHSSWIYFAKRFGFEIVGQIEDKPGIPPSPKHRDEIITLMNETGTRIVLAELFYDQIPSQYIAKRTNAKLVRVPIDVGAIPEAKDYFALISYLLQRLSE